MTRDCITQARDLAIWVYENANIINEDAIREGLKPLLDATDMAIAALREQEERSKGCSACEMTTRGLTYKQIEYGTLRGDFINDSNGMYIIRYGGGQHSIVCDDDGAEIDIEFCPMCGRRLEEV